MKSLKTTLILFFISTLSITAQSKDTEKADKYFNEFEFIKAIDSYKKLVDSNSADAYVYTQLAEANFNIFNTTEAEKWYAKALEISDDNADVIYKYAEMLRANGNYEKSNLWMQKFIKKVPNDERAISYKSNPDYISNILDGEKLYELQGLSFNSSESDFGGTYKDGVLYFASGRDTSGKKYRWENESFLEVYQVQLGNEASSDLNAQKVKGSVNTKNHEGLVSFSPDGNTMYFSRESFYEGDYIKDKDNKTKTSVIYLFKAQKVDDRWTNVEALPFNNKSYSVKNPAVSADGKTLFFSSNMPESNGGYDIFKVAINDDGSYSDPVNLGTKVNTKDHEMFPYVSDNNTLYFSSTGHLGLGGLDVFYLGDDDKVYNIGVPVNSNSDDLAFTINEETGEGFVSSNRKGGKGNDDIYAVKRLKPCRVLITATVEDIETSKVLSGATVTITDSSGKVLSTQTSDEYGKITYTSRCNMPLDFKAVLSDYESNQVSFTGSEKEEETVQIMLSPIEKIIKDEKIELTPILFEYDKANITAQGAFELDKLVAVMKKFPDMVILTESHTDSRGTKRYNKKLSEKRAKATVQYVISKGIDKSRISGVGKGEDELKVKCGSKCTDEDHKTNRRSEFIIVEGKSHKQ